LLLLLPVDARAAELEAHVIVFATPADRPEEEHALAVRATAARLEGSPFELRASVLPADEVALEWARRQAAEPEVVGVFWYEVDLEGEATVWALAAGWEGPRVRTIPAADATSVAAMLESIGLIVRSTALALHDAAQPPEPDRQAPTSTESAPPPPAPPPPRSEGRLPIALAYVGETFAREQAWQSSVSLEVGWRPHALFAFGIGYRLPIPQWIDAEGISIRTWRHAVELHAGARGRFADAFSMDFEVLGGVEPLRAETRSSDPSIVAAAPRWRMLVTVGPRVRARFFVWRTLSIDLQLGAVFALRRFDFVIDDAGVQNSVLSPRGVRARAGIGIGYAFF
jgi:hypothetical protein